MKLAEAYGGVRLRCADPDELDAADPGDDRHAKPVIFDCVVSKEENCFPMIPSGKAHNEMLLGERPRTSAASSTRKGKALV